MGVKLVRRLCDKCHEGVPAYFLVPSPELWRFLGRAYKFHRKEFCLCGKCGIAFQAKVDTEKQPAGAASPRRQNEAAQS